MATLTETIRNELRARGTSIRKVHLATGLERATVRAFLDGKEVHSSTLDTLAEYLGTSLSFNRPKEAKPKK
jgi:lambda repressor-like predicted transcriptional regulator